MGGGHRELAADRRLLSPGAPVTAISKSPTSIDLFVVGNDGRVYTSWWYEGLGWSGIRDNWRSIGGFFPKGAPVTAIAKSPNSIDLFITGNDGRVYTSWWYEGSDWSGIRDNWRSIGGFFPAGIPVTAMTRDAGNLDLFIAGNDHRVYTESWQNGSEWSGIRDNWRPLAPDEMTFSGTVVTPAGTALGGNVRITVRRDGTWTAAFHMHDSGAVGYDFQVTATLVTPDGLTLIARHGGHVGGTFSSGSRDDDFQENGHNPLIQAQWTSVARAKLWVTKDYSTTGVVGVIQDVAKGVLDVAAGAVGGAVGIVIALGAEAGQFLGNLGLGATFGVIAGVVVFAFGGSVVLAIAAGVAVGAMTNALIKQRPLWAEEAKFANGEVFGGTLPADRITLTHLAGLGGRPFTMPGVDGRIYVNIGGDAFDAGPLKYKNKAYPVEGGLLIHELVHAWQISHSAFLPGTVCQGIVVQANNQVGESVYQYPAPGGAWSSFGIEQQAAIVDQWFAGTPTAAVPRRTPKSPGDPYFAYIRDNIRKGVA
ncbi:hypothetical protein ACIBQ6_48450 [Nonomuraea sp. NPDC049655]|uniref:hypothetical protein n=1 Tax=Nonomuraea sp. NPDC049655 TaxID=3364355 RepID=UPI00379EC7F6